MVPRKIPKDKLRKGKHTKQGDIPATARKQKDPDKRKADMPNKVRVNYS